MRTLLLTFIGIGLCGCQGDSGAVGSTAQVDSSAAVDSTPIQQDSGPTAAQREAALRIIHHDPREQ